MFKKRGATTNLSKRPHEEEEEEEANNKRVKISETTKDDSKGIKTSTREHQN